MFFSRRPTLPPSVLPDISPTRGEIGSFGAGDWLISPLVGDMSGPEGGNVGRYPDHKLSELEIGSAA